MVDVVIPSDNRIRKKEHEKQEKYQGMKEKMEKNVECEGSSGANTDQDTGSCNPQTGLLAPADTRNNIWDLCPEERITGISYDPVQNPQVPGPLVEDQSLKEATLPRERGR